MQTVQLTDCVYDCGLCKQPHSYTEGELYELHFDLRIGQKRMIYKEVA